MKKVKTLMLGLTAIAANFRCGFPVVWEKPCAVAMPSQTARLEHFQNAITGMFGTCGILLLPYKTRFTFSSSTSH